MHTPMDASVEQLQHQVDALTAMVAHLSATLEACRDELADLRGRVAATTSAPDTHMPARRVALASMIGAAAGLALAARPVAAKNGDAVLAGGSVTSTGVTRITTTGQTAFQGTNSAPTGITYGVIGAVASNQGDGVFGENTTTGFGGTGVRGRIQASQGVGVLGEHTGTSGQGAGVFGTVRTSDSKASGVAGVASATTGGAVGVRGTADGPTGAGVLGWARATSGNTYGVSGWASSGGGFGVYGINYATSGQACGVYGTTASATGYALYGHGNLRVTGRCYLAVPASAPPATMLGAGTLSFWLDTSTNTLKISVKDGSSVTRTATLPLM